MGNLWYNETGSLVTGLKRSKIKHKKSVSYQAAVSDKWFEDRKHHQKPLALSKNSRTQYYIVKLSEIEAWDYKMVWNACNLITISRVRSEK